MSLHDSASPILPPLGKAMKAEFLMDPGFIQLNHGSYGTYPKDVQKSLHAIQARAEKNIDRWMRLDVFEELKKVRSLLAAYMNADDPDDLVIVPNTTGGMNAIFRSMTFEAGDKILYFSITYNSMKAIIQYVVDSSNGNVTKVEFDIRYPLTNDELLRNFSAFLDAQHESPKSRIRIALIDHISSLPGVVNPVQDMIPLLKAKNILVLVDGAHAIGQVPIDLKSLDPDFYVTNCHKWLYAVRGTAVMYVKKIHQPWIHPAQISSPYSTPSDFQQEFFWTGTLDFSNFLTVPAALEFRSKIGEERLRSYVRDLVIDGGRLISKILGTQIIQTEEQIGFMIDVQLPFYQKNEVEAFDPIAWGKTLLNRFNMFLLTYKYNDAIYIRLSAQVYTELSDFQKVAEAIVIMCDEHKKESETVESNYKNL